MSIFSRLWAKFADEFHPFALAREFLVEGIFKSEEGRKQAAKLLHANFGGLGTDDEVLTLSAITEAERQGLITSEDADRFNSVLASLPRSERAKIIMIIGKDEQEITDANGNKSQLNQRGINMVAVLARKDRDELLTALKAAGSMDTLAKNFNAEGLHRTARDLSRNTGANNNWLGRLAENLEREGDQ